MTLFNTPPPATESEDCLYLNVFAPSGTTPASLLPVMVWIYGGDLKFGSASSSFYDGSSIAGNQNVIVVTFNYRTNGKHILVFFIGQIKHLHRAISDEIQFLVSQIPQNCPI